MKIALFPCGLRGMVYSQVPNHVMIGVRTNLALMADLEGEEGPKRDKLTFLQWQDGGTLKPTLSLPSLRSKPFRVFGAPLRYRFCCNPPRHYWGEDLANFHCNSFVPQSTVFEEYFWTRLPVRNIRYCLASRECGTFGRQPSPQILYISALGTYKDQT